MHDCNKRTSSLEGGVPIVRDGGCDSVNFLIFNDVDRSHPSPATGGYSPQGERKTVLSPPLSKTVVRRPPSIMGEYELTLKGSSRIT